MLGEKCPPCTSFDFCLASIFDQQQLSEQPREDKGAPLLDGLCGALRFLWFEFSSPLSVCLPQLAQTLKLTSSKRPTEMKYSLTLLGSLPPLYFLSFPLGATQLDDIPYLSVGKRERGETHM